MWGQCGGHPEETSGCGLSEAMKLKGEVVLKKRETKNDSRFQLPLTKTRR